MEINITHHAKVRQQQRCVSNEIIDWLLTYGSRRRDGRGCFRIFFTKERLQEMRRKLGQRVAALWHKLAKVYLVLSAAGDVITVGYRC